MAETESSKTGVRGAEQRRDGARRSAAYAKPDLRKGPALTAVAAAFVGSGGGSSG